MSWLLAHTLCKMGRHVGRKQMKFDGGKCPLLCKHCRLIVGYAR